MMDRLLERVLAAVAPGDDWLGEQRRAAAEYVRSHGLPDIRQEDWKYTNLKPLADIAYRAARGDDAGQLDRAGFATLPRAATSRYTAVLVNGYLRPDLSTLDALPRGVSVRSIAACLAEDPRGLAEIYSTPTAPFTALNSALADDGVVVDVADGEACDEPLHIVHVVAGDEPLVCAPRVLIRLGRNARARVIEEFLGTPGNRGLTNVVSGVDLARGSTLFHHRLQDEPVSAAHVGRLAARVYEAATLHSDSVAFGGALTRVDIDVELAARGARCHLNGLFAVTGSQHVDHHTTIDHQVADTHSEELYRGILDERSRGVFNGKVIVRPGAQGITARQSSHNLLLARGAEIDTKPELEIYADDVSCAHGATVGELDQAQLFYLRSRGVSEARARALLTYAFAARVVESIPLDSLRRAIELRFIGHHDQSELVTLLNEEASP